MHTHRRSQLPLWILLVPWGTSSSLQAELSCLGRQRPSVLTHRRSVGRFFPKKNLCQAHLWFRIWPPHLVIQGCSPDGVTCGLENQDPKRPSLCLCQDQGPCPPKCWQNPSTAIVSQRGQAAPVRLPWEEEKLRAEGVGGTEEGLSWVFTRR